MQDIFYKVVQLLAVLFAISLHESAHAWVAYRCGDPTAKFQGRITLNPIPHIDLIGTIVFPLMLAIIGAPVFGWAKPVMVNPYNFRHPRRDGIFVSAAGPISNILASVIFILFFLFLKAVFFIKLLPLMTFVFYLIVINIYLAVFNLIPVPPLDGSGIVEGFLKGRARQFYSNLRPYGFIILLVIIYSNILNFIANPIMRLITDIMGMN